MKKTKNNPLIDFFKNINLAMRELVHAGEFDIDVDLKDENELLTRDPKEAFDKIQASVTSTKSRARVSSIEKAPEAIETSKVAKSQEKPSNTKVSIDTKSSTAKAPKVKQSSETARALGIVEDDKGDDLEH